MRKRRPEIASLEQVHISRQGHDAVIEYTDPAIATTHFRIGPSLRGMSDQQVLDAFNAVLQAEAELAAQPPAAVEIPPGRPQIYYHADACQWAPRGNVLRCVVDDSGPGGEAVVHIDEQALSLAEFGRLLCTYSGWGMRIVFVPEDALGSAPHIELRDPEDR